MKVLVNLLNKITQGLEKSLLNTEPKTDGSKPWPSPKALSEALLIISANVSGSDDHIGQALVGLLFASNFDVVKSLDSFLFDKCLAKVIQKLSSERLSTVSKLIHVYHDSLVAATTSGDALKKVRWTP